MGLFTSPNSMKGPFMFEGKKRQEEGLLFPDSLAAGRPKTARKNWVTTFPPHSGRLVVLIDVLQCYSEPTFRYKTISQNQCDTASEIFSSMLNFFLFNSMQNPFNGKFWELHSF